MNGPTRSSAFRRHTALRGDAPRLSGDVFDELDQFVDSEPAVWSPASRPAPRRLTVAEGAASDADEAGDRRQPPGGTSGQEGDRDEGGSGEALERTAPAEEALDTQDAAFIGSAAFSREGSRRATAFAKRLSDELARPKPPASPPEPSDAESDGWVAPSARDAVGDGVAEDDALSAPSARPTSASTKPFPQRSMTAPVAPQAVPSPSEAPDPSPVDALDWELDHAIGAIIASGRVEAAGTQADPAQPAPDETMSPAAPRATAQDAPPVSSAPARSLATPVGPHVRPGPSAASPAPVAAPDTTLSIAASAPFGSRRKPIPTFRYERREDPAEPFPAAPPDLDDPLATVFFPDARGALDTVRPHAGGPASAWDGNDDEFEDDDYEPGEDEDEDELPPSLARAARGGRAGRAPRRRGLVALIGGIAVVGLAAAVGVNVFAGSDTGLSEPPIIRADARDVKVRPDDADGQSEARPDISERAALGDSDRLVVPDPVRIAAQGRLPDDDARAPRQVRTVVVRPDGTIVPTEIARDAEAADSGAAPESRGPAAPPAEPAQESAALPGPAEDGADPSSQSDADISTAYSLAERADPTTGADPLGYAGDAEAVTPDIGAIDPPGSDGDDADVAPDGFDAPDDTALGAPDAAADGASVAVVPRPRPTPPPRTSRSARVVATASPAPAAASAAADDMPWGAQLASQRSRADAEASMNRIKRSYGSILDGEDLMIIESTVGDRGTFYRVRVGANSQGEASSLCARLKGAGADCFVGRN